MVAAHRGPIGFLYGVYRDGRLPDPVLHLRQYDGRCCLVPLDDGRNLPRPPHQRKKMHGRAFGEDQAIGCLVKLHLLGDRKRLWRDNLVSLCRKQTPQMIFTGIAIFARARAGALHKPCCQSGWGRAATAGRSNHKTVACHTRSGILRIVPARWPAHQNVSQIQA